MQPDLPWNVAGIPPEAREAARAAARREGLSVGEWLTRKILRTLSEAAGGLESTTENWRNAAASSAAAYRTVAESAAAATRDTEDMLARVSRSEDQSQSAYQRIEDHLKGVARRLDSAERSQAENNRAMSKAASEINVAAREQAQAFDQLDGHVMALADRLDRVEQSANANGLKDAVKGLHSGLSRLADQIADTANHSASQIATLAQNVESLAGRLAQARQDAETTSKALKDHLLTVDARVKTIETDDGAGQALAGLRETLDMLSSRFSETEAQSGGAMARLEDSVAKLQGRVEDSGFDHRLAAIEQAIADLSGRYQQAGQDIGQAMHEELHQLNDRFDAADRQHRREIAELRNAVEEVEAARAAPPPAPQPAEPPPPQPQAAMPPQPQDAMPAQPQSVSGFDLPPFPQAPQPQAAPPLPEHQAGYAQEAAAPATPFDPAAGFATEQHFSGVQPFDTTMGNAFEAQSAAGYETPHHGPAASAESFIAATRRQARAATADAQAVQGQAGFSWGTPAAAPEKPGRSRYVLIGGIAVILLAALATGMFFFRAAQNGAQQAQPAQTAAPANTAPPIVGSSLPETPDVGLTPAPDADNATAQPHVSAATPAPRPTPKAAKPAAAPAQKTAAVSPMDKLTSAAKAGNAKAQTVLGLKYLDGDGVTANEAEGARWLERAAKQGQPVAEYRLGTLYERGHGVPSDPKQAAIWYAAAAKQGNRKAMHNLAVAYAQGSGVTKNFTVAAQWFAHAAKLGLRDSQFNLAVLYERGMGVPQNLTDAFKWYAIAAAQGDSESKARITALSSQIKPAKRASAQKAADAFKPAPLDRAANVAPTLANL